MQTKSKVSNEHLFVMQQAQRNPRSFVAPPVHTSHLSPCPSFLEGKGEDISAFPASATGQQPPESQQRAKRKEMSFSLPQHQLPASPGASHPTPGLIQSTQGLSQTPTGSGSGLWFPPSRVLNQRSDPSASLHRQIQIQINIQTLAQNTVLAWPASRCESGLGTRCLSSSATASEESL